MTIYCDKCGARHECSVCPVCAGFGLSKLQEAAGVGKSFQPTDELRAKFEEWYPNAIGDVQPFECYMKGYASRDAEVEALRKDAERYRWLRDRVTGTDKKPFICIFHGNFSLWNGEHADREIDAAMQAE